jgi:beta-glucosidase
VTEYPQLPTGFVFGTSTSAYQVEGSVSADGRRPSTWDVFAAQPGRITDGTTGEVACDHYRRVDDDVALMADLGVGGYRFSVAWPRVVPEGVGAVNDAGLDHYDRLVDLLLERGIEPMATLYHWDLPQPLESVGGWLRRETVDAFAGYAEAVAARLADRVAHWCPVNEPVIRTIQGYALGVHAPGETLLLDALPALHHLLLAHGRAVEVLRAAGATSVGTANNHTPVWVAADTDEDRAAAELYDVLHNRLVSDALLTGAYPEGWEQALPVRDDDLALIGAPLDFYGVNYYNPTRVGVGGRASRFGAGAGLDTDALGVLPFSVLDVEGYPLTDFGWPVVPDGLREVLVGLRDRYPGLPPVHVTENGCSDGTGPDADGVVDDRARVEFLDGHLRAAAAAVAEGVDVRGYWTWSLLDNWEWAEGFTQRFGLVHVDFGTQVRTPKRSAGWYRDCIAAQHS